MKGVDFALGNYVKAFKDKPLSYLRLPGPIRGFYWLVWMEANRSGLIPVADATRDELGEALGVILQVDPVWAQECIAKLLDKGFVTFSAGAGGNAIVVTDYVTAQTTATLDKVRAKEYRQRQHDVAVASSSSRAVTPRDESSRTVTNKDKIRDRDRSEIDKISPNGEYEGGQAPPKTDPTPSLRKQKFDEVLGKGPASWGMEGSGSYQNDPAKAQHPTPVPPAPSPHTDRQGPTVTVVDPKAVPDQIPPAAGVPGRSATLVDLGPSNAPRKAPAKKSAAKRGANKVDGPQPFPLPDDFAPDEGLYEFGRTLGLQKKHVDYFTDEMRDHAIQNGRVQLDWRASLRTWMRNGLKYNNGRPPEVPDPLPPKRVLPPCPPPSPEVLARAQVWKERMDAGETIDVKSLFKPKFVVPPIENDFAEDRVG